MRKSAGFISLTLAVLVSALLLPAATAAGPDACGKGAPPASWSPKKRGCFAISAKISWQWENSGKPPQSPCTGAIRQTATWSGAGLKHHWIGDDFSIRIGPSFGLRDAGATLELNGPITFDVKLTGETQGRAPGSCVPWVTTGCGKKAVPRHTVNLGTSLREGKPSLFVLTTRDRSQSPYRSCGHPEGLPMIPLSVWAPWTVVAFQQTKGLGVDPWLTMTTVSASINQGRTYRDRYQAAARVAAGRLLATRVGASKTFRGTDAPGHIVDFQGTGRWTASVTFKRLR